jgi:multidrug resistance efflux pump
MPEHAPIRTPWSLLAQRARYQVVPVLTMIACVVVAGWLWTRSASSAVTTGEVNAVRVSVESKFPGLLQEIPNRIRVFDTVKSGQTIARLDVDLAEAELQRLEAESQRLGETQPPAGATTNPAWPDRQARITELRLRIDARDIKSPIDGTVMHIFERPGQSTDLGQPIMTIASDRGEYIIGYLRENQGTRPHPGMSVTIRTRGAGSRRLRSYVETVAPQVEPLPERHLRKVAVPEWGLPVKIAIPPEAELKPGEMVELIFHAGAG